MIPRTMGNGDNGDELTQEEQARQAHLATLASKFGAVKIAAEALHGCAAGDDKVARGAFETIMKCRREAAKIMETHRIGAHGAPRLDEPVEQLLDGALVELQRLIDQLRPRNRQIRGS